MIDGNIRLESENVSIKKPDCEYSKKPDCEYSSSIKEERRRKRLKKASEYQKRRLASETFEERAARLFKASEYQKKRIAEETPKKRAARLLKASLYQKTRREFNK